MTVRWILSLHSKEKSLHWSREVARCLLASSTATPTTNAHLEQRLCKGRALHWVGAASHLIHEHERSRLSPAQHSLSHLRNVRPFIHVRDSMIELDVDKKLNIASEYCFIRPQHAISLGSEDWKRRPIAFHVVHSTRSRGPLHPRTYSDTSGLRRNFYFLSTSTLRNTYRIFASV